MQKHLITFYVALSRANSYAEGAFGLYDLQAVINSLNETKWYGFRLFII